LIPAPEKREKRYHEVVMGHSVTITTPRLTWDEIVQQYGLSKADQKFVIRLVDEKVTRRPAGATRKLRSASSKSAQTEAQKNGGAARKKTNRARASA
jgi:aspartyl-tRNA synthetase